MNKRMIVGAKLMVSVGQCCIFVSSFADIPDNKQAEKRAQLNALLYGSRGEFLSLAIRHVTYQKRAVVFDHDIKT